LVPILVQMACGHLNQPCSPQQLPPMPRLHYADCWSALTVLLALLLRGCEVDGTILSPASSARLPTMPKMPKTTGSQEAGGARAGYRVPHDVVGNLLPVGFLLQIMR
jgi:hypothetical protein